MSNSSAFFATAGDDGLIKVFDPETLPSFAASQSRQSSSSSSSSSDNYALRVFRGHVSYATCCAFAGEGCSYPLIASVSLDATVKLWDTRTPEAVFVLNLRTAARSIAFARGTSSLLFTAGNDGIFLWDVRKHSSFLEALEEHSSTTAASTIASRMMASPNTPYIGRLRRPSIVPAPPKTPMTPATPASQQQQKYEVKFLYFNSPPMPPFGAAGFTPKSTMDRPTAVYADKNRSSKLVFDKFTKEYRQPFTGHSEAPYSVITTKDGCHLISSAADNTHKMWDLHAKRGLCTFDGADLSHSTTPALSPDDNSLMLCGSADGSVAIWQTYAMTDATTTSTLKDRGNTVCKIRVNSFPITANVWSPDGASFVTGDTSGCLMAVLP